MTFDRAPAADDPEWPRASAWLRAGQRDASVRLLGIPSSRGSISASRASDCPAAVREALQRLAAFDARTETPLTDIPIFDEGDLDVAELSCSEMTAHVREELHQRATDRPDARWILVGGDNAITRPGVAGLFAGKLERTGVITLDAHHDVRHLDEGPRNGNPIRGLIAEEGLPGANVVQIGIGAFTNAPIHRQWCRSAGVTIVDADDIHRDGVTHAIDVAASALSHCDVLYLDVDMDVLDIAHAPACPGSRPGGLTPTQLSQLVRTLAADPRLRAADITEVDPTTDVAGATVLAAATVALELAVSFGASRN